MNEFSRLIPRVNYSIILFNFILFILQIIIFYFIKVKIYYFIKTLDDKIQSIYLILLYFNAAKFILSNFILSSL